MTEHISHQYEGTGTLIDLYLLTSIILVCKQQDKTFLTEWYWAFPNYSALNFLMHEILIC